MSSVNSLRDSEFPSCQSELLRVMMLEDTQYLARRQKTLLPRICHGNFCPLNPVETMWKQLDGVHIHCGFIPQLRPPELRKPQVFVMGFQNTVQPLLPNEMLFLKCRRAKLASGPAGDIISALTELSAVTTFSQTQASEKAASAFQMRRDEALAAKACPRAVDSAQTTMTRYLRKEAGASKTGWEALGNSSQVSTLQMKAHRGNAVLPAPLGTVFWVLFKVLFLMSVPLKGRKLVALGACWPSLCQ